ncbi:hypothetical protein NM208_g12670 [Fusarium decemcellulare]|uniref:Uncharacterized protein n=1 Tax=Fusarium decemcellulare TaxID=57161 RepID=A0ACC1RMR2_9HYPO|nr:hypothetical protein NM208_g12670 [Fusarium decemcellulare]
MAEVAEKSPATSPEGGIGDDHNKEANMTDRKHNGFDSDEPIDPNAQAGVQNMQAITSVWTRPALITAYISIWIIYFVDSMQQANSTALKPYVTSAFQSHSLTPTTDIMSSIIGGVFKLTLAKILDVFGRPQGYFLSLCLLTLGLVMMAGCNGVETYAAAQVFYWVGYNGLDYSLTIFIADTSALKNRALMLAYASSPYIITTWITGYMTTDFLNGPGFRWGYGVFCIITPAVTLPLFGLFMHYYYKAKHMGLLPERGGNRTWWQSIYHYGREFDAIGLLLITAGISLFLLPFNIYSYQKEQWKAPIIICFFIFGGILIIAFAIWEKFFAPVKFLPYHLLTDRTVLGSCVLAGSVFVSFYCWDAYFTSFLQVVNGLTVVEQTWVSSIYTTGSCLWSIPVGLYIRRFGRFKWLCLFFGVGFTILGVGLMLKFRTIDTDVGYIVMCQIFIAFAGGTIVISEQTAAMAAVEHQFIAVVLAIQYMFANIGGGIGLSIAAAIWQGVFPKELAKRLPESALANLTTIYESLPAQLSYEWGSEERIAIQESYAAGQKMMLIAGTATLAIAAVSVLVWHDYDVRDRKQVKGRVV